MRQAKYFHYEKSLLSIFTFLKILFYSLPKCLKSPIIPMGQTKLLGTL